MKKETQMIVDAPYSEDIVKKFTTVKKGVLDKLVDYYQNEASKFIKANGIQAIPPVTLNGRIKKTLGMYSIPCGIELNKSQAILDYVNGTNLMLDTLHHECCHYICAYNGLDDRDGSDDFENMLAQNNVASSGSTREYNRASKKALEFYLIKDKYVIVNSRTNKELSSITYNHTKKPKYSDVSDLVYKGCIPVKLNRVGFTVVKCSVADWK